MFTVYILFSESLNKYYVGHTGNLQDRIYRHNHRRSKATKAGIPWKLVYTEQFKTKVEAYQKEMQIKKQKSRIYIEKLINTNG